MKPKPIPFASKKPEGENFFLVTVDIEAPNDPCWNDGFIVFGHWDSVMMTLHQWLMTNPDMLNHISAELYQGEAARKKRLAVLETEIRYQDQKRSQPNN